MSQINQLLIKRNELITEIRDIEQTCEGIENENNAKKISELNLRQASLSAEKISISSKLSDLEYELNEIAEEIRALSGTGIDRILEAIKYQRLQHSQVNGHIFKHNFMKRQSYSCLSK